MKQTISPTGEDGFLTQLVAGGTAGALGGLVSTPLDCIKTRIQTDDRPNKSFRNTFLELYAQEGVAGFTKGTSSFIREFLFSVIY